MTSKLPKTEKELSALLVEAELNGLKKFQAEWYADRYDGVLEERPNPDDDWLGAGLYDRIKELQQGASGISQDDTTPTAVGNKADNLKLAIRQAMDKQGYKSVPLRHELYRAIAPLLNIEEN